MDLSPYSRRILWALGLLLLFGLRAAAMAQDADESRAHKPKKPALYDPKADARAQVEAAVARARRDHARVLVMFGFEGCSWCHKLHRLFEQDEEIRKVLRDEYVLVLVDIHAPHAEELLREVKGVLAPDDLQKAVGFPFLGVLDDNCKAVTAQPTGPLEKGDGHDPAKVKGFLGRWVAPRTDARVASLTQHPQPSVEELRRLVEQREQEAGAAQAALAAARARLARAEGKRELAAAEWRKVLAHDEGRLQAVRELCARGRICSAEPLEEALGAVAVDRVWLADLEGSRDDLLAELPKAIAYYEFRVRWYESLRRHVAIPEGEAQQALKESGEELRKAQERLAALRGTPASRVKPGKGGKP
jgi:thioredoxin-related protein